MHPQRKYSLPAVPVTKEGIKIYERDLGLNVRSLRGKAVLDIGAGYGKFQEECQELGIPVIALDPVYRNPKKVSECFEAYLKVARNRRNKIVGINETLPFRENSFDVVLSNCSSFHYLYLNYPRNRRYEMAKEMFEEIIRILKPSGEARICKVRQRSKDRIIYDTALKKIAKQSYPNISWKFVTIVISRKLDGKKSFGFEEYLVLHKLAKGVH